MIIGIGLLFVAFITSASLLVLIDVSSLGTLPFWLTCGMAVLIFAVWGALRIAEHRNYDVRVRKFAAVNKFNFIARADGNSLLSEESMLFKAHSSSKVVYDQDVIEGKHNGIPFKFGTHIAEYAGPESEKIIENVSILKMDLKKQFPHILIVGGGKAIPRSVLRRLWAQPQPATTNFQQHFQVFVLEGKKAWNIVIPSELQQHLLKLERSFDIEICGSSISFYQKNKFNLKQIPRIFWLADEFK